MDRRRLVKVAAMAALLCFVLALAIEYADAAAAVAEKGDKGLAAKKGVAGSLGTKKTDESKKPSVLQMGIGIGSVFVAIAVIKWL